MRASNQFADVTAGVVYVHASPAAVCPHVEWALSSTLQSKANLVWTPQPAMPGQLRAVTMTDRWMDLFGYFAPAVVSTTDEEYRACRRPPALMDFSMLRKVDLDGPGAAELVNSVVARDLRKVPAGRIAYGAMTDEHGKMIDDCTCMTRSPRRCASAAPTTATTRSSRRAQREHR